MKKDQPAISKKAIFAAGAILWRGATYHSEIAVIHRSRYGDERCLPKGKVKEDETIEQATISVKAYLPTATAMITKKS